MSEPSGPGPAQARNVRSWYLGWAISWWSASRCTAGFVTSTCRPRSTAARAMARCVGSGVKTVTASPGASAAMAASYARPSRPHPSSGNEAKPVSSPLYRRPIRSARCARIAGNLVPSTPAMLSRPTLPRRRRSNSVSATTPAFLSEAEGPPPTKPVVYSPVPTLRPC
ncbi:hypothetical protein CDD83_10107 [Cordyceps sp. RAO-2017]|nr:hypothetical protein CDD83_10107 [Cordyceps sp. RAO-2017]